MHLQLILLMNAIEHDHEHCDYWVWDPRKPHGNQSQRVELTTCSVDKVTMPSNGVFVFQTLWTLSTSFSCPLLSLQIRGVLNPDPVALPLLGDTVSPKSQPVPVRHLFLISCPSHGPTMWSKGPSSLWTHCMVLNACLLRDTPCAP